DDVCRGSLGGETGSVGFGGSGTDSGRSGGSVSLSGGSFVDFFHQSLAPAGSGGLASTCDGVSGGGSVAIFVSAGIGGRSAFGPSPCHQPSTCTVATVDSSGSAGALDAE